MATAESASCLDVVVCTCAGRQYTARDTLDAAIFRGELENKWKKFLRDVAAEERASELDLDPDETAISAAAEAFRYENDLITAEETEAWLTNRNLTLDDFSDYFARRYYADALTEEIADDLKYQSASPELRHSFLAALIFSRDFDRIVTEFMWRLAAHCVELDPKPEEISAEKRRFFERTEVEPAQLPAWLKNIGRDSTWFAEMLAWEAIYHRCCERILVPHARQRELSELQLLLVKFETELVGFKSRDAAREGLFCIREDGMSMEQVAAEGPYPYRRETFILEDIPPEAQQAFASVSAGEVVGPVAGREGFELCRVINKIEPQTEDPAVQSRIDQRLLERHFCELATRHVQRRFGGNLRSTE